MREQFFILCVFVIFGFVYCQYYFVTTPNVIRFEHDETVVVSVFGLNNARVKIGLQYKGKKFSEKEVVVENEEQPETTSVRVTEADLFRWYKVEDKPRILQVCSEYQRSTQCRDVIISYQSGYLIVQTDQPIYTPQQKVMLRTLALEESLKPSTKREVTMEIISSTNLTMARISKLQSDSGFFQHEFTLPPFPDLGTWTARAFYSGQFETSATSQFEVSTYVLPTFGVSVDVDVPYILQDTANIQVTVRAKYLYGNTVEGKARVLLNLKDKLGSSEHIMGIIDGQPQNNGDIEFLIEIEKILNSTLLKDRGFPDGSLLEIIAWVIETASGKEEAGRNDIMFLRNLYRFHFSRSKVNFRPGLEYYLKIDVTFVNGKPVEHQDVSVYIVNNGQLETTQVKNTGHDGQLVAIFPTSGNDILTFRASIGEGPLKVESEDFMVTPYAGKNQIQVERSTFAADEMWIFTNNDLSDRFTGMLFMVVTRGKVVYTVYEKYFSKNSTTIPGHLQEYITPSARLLIFYVDKITKELVADSVRFDVEKRCNLHVTLETNKTKVLPGTSDRLYIKGSPFMYVGLNVIDKELLMMNNKNSLTKNKMFEALASHDLGCGEGSGKSSGDVFKKSGLTVLTNAVVSNEDLKRESETCARSKRRKRDVYDSIVLNGDEYDYQSDLNKLYERRIYPKQRSDFQQSWLFDEVQLDMCPIFISIITTPMPVVNIRMELEGEKKPFVTFPDTITEWTFQAFDPLILIVNFKWESYDLCRVVANSLASQGITEEKGMCIADSLDVKVHRDFWIQLDLPYQAVRLEYLNVKATIFNYLQGNRNKSVNIYIEVDERLCSNTEPGKQSPKIQVDLPPKSSTAVSFPIIPLKAGSFFIEVSAFTSTDDDVPVFDIVTKKLYVVNEGIQEKLTIQVCLDPNLHREDCINDPRVKRVDLPNAQVQPLIVDLTLPKDSIAGTGHATGYLQGTIKDNVVTTLLNGVDSLFRQPKHDGEATMIFLSKNVYGLFYQITHEIVDPGNKWIRDGVLHMVSQYRHADGAYAAWRHRTASTWLTAFVAKVFCQANSVVVDVVDVANDLLITLRWLSNHVQSDGSFVDNMPVITREMIEVVKTIEKARKYVENLDWALLRSNPYILAMSTYALAMAGSEKKWEFKSLLESQAHTNGRYIYWGDAEGNPASANAVETTAYALLAMLKFNDLGSSAPIVNWLTSQRSAHGSLRSTQETVVVLQALSTYRQRTHFVDLNLKILLSEPGNSQKFTLSKESVQHIVHNLPVERGDNRLTVLVTGSGSARMTIDLRYNRPATDDEICPFHITEVEVFDAKELPKDNKIAHDLNCDVCGNCDYPEQDQLVFDTLAKPEPQTESTEPQSRNSKTCIRFSVKSKSKKARGITIVNFGLQTDVEVLQEDLKKLMQDNPNIIRYELPSSGSGFILFYLDQTTPVETIFIFRLKDNNKGNIERKPSSYVKVYDYSNPDRHCTKIYGTNRKRYDTIGYKCKDDNRQNCRCVRNTCAINIVNRIARNIGRRPHIQLLAYTCNPEKADYAVLVTIKELNYDHVRGEKTAIGLVTRNIYGFRNNSRSAEMKFFWNIYCDEVELRKGSQYYIIGKSGYPFNQGPNDKEIRYPLMGTTLVIEDKNDKQVVDIVMHLYENLINKSGCLH